MSHLAPETLASFRRELSFRGLASDDNIWPGSFIETIIRGIREKYRNAATMAPTPSDADLEIEMAHAQQSFATELTNRCPQVRVLTEIQVADLLGCIHDVSVRNTVARARYGAFLGDVPRKWIKPVQT